MICFPLIYCNTSGNVIGFELPETWQETADFFNREPRLRNEEIYLQPYPLIVSIAKLYHALETKSRNTQVFDGKIWLTIIEDMLTRSPGNGGPQKKGEPKKTKSSNHPFRQFSPQVLNDHGGRDCFLSLFVPPASLRGTIFTDILNGFYIVNLDRYIA